MFKALQQAWDFAFSPVVRMVPRKELVQAQRLLEQSIQSNEDLLLKYNQTGVYLDQLLEMVNEHLVIAYINELKKNPIENAAKIEKMTALQGTWSAQLRNFRVEIAKYQASKR